MIRCVVVVCKPSRKRRSGLGRWDVWEARCVGLGGEMCDFLLCEWTGMVTNASFHFGHLCNIYDLHGSGIVTKRNNQGEPLKFPQSQRTPNWGRALQDSIPPGRAPNTQWLYGYRPIRKTGSIKYHPIWIYERP